MPTYDIRSISINEVDKLCSCYHAYKAASATATYAFGVFEDGALVAAYSWQPPPYGAAKSVNHYVPYGVLALSRMVAVPKDQRKLKHISKPLMLQMKKLIDRTRWPSLVTYSDEGLGHSGHVYKCSGWTQTKRSLAQQYEYDGIRTSPYRNGKYNSASLTPIGKAYIQRWEHHIVPVEESARFMTDNGWVRQAIDGKVWKSGAPAYRIVKIQP